MTKQTLMQMTTKVSSRGMGVRGGVGRHVGRGDASLRGDARGWETGADGIREGRGDARGGGDGR